jgi:hypothetical protein
MKAERDRALEELLRLREELRIKDARMAIISPHRRPHYPPTERLAILELKSVRGWSLEQTARVFHVTATTIASWLGRLDEEGPDALVQTRTPVNRFPDLVRYIVQRLKTLCPSMGKMKIVGVVVDHFSRRIMGIGVFAKRPNCREFCAFMGRTIARTAKPKYIIGDNCFNTEIGSTSTARTRRWAAGRRTKCTMGVDHCIGARVSNREDGGHVVRRARGRGRWLPGILATTAHFVSTSNRVGLICPWLR